MVRGEGPEGRTASEGERIRSIKHGGLAHWLRSSWALRAAPSTSGLYALLYTNHPAACSLLPLLPFALSLSPASPSLRFHLSSGIGNSESRPCCSLRRFRSCFLPDISPPFFFSFRSTEIIKVRNEKEASRGRENARDVSREIWNRNGIGTEINAINLQ